MCSSCSTKSEDESVSNMCNFLAWSSNFLMGTASLVIVFGAFKTPQDEILKAPHCMTRSRKKKPLWRPLAVQI